MDYLSAIILGLVQGLTEFLPVSSSGHLVLSQHLLGFQGPNVAFDLLLHLATTLAVIIYFRAELANILLSIFGKSPEKDGRRWLVMMVLASIPTAMIGFVFQEQVEALFGAPRTVACMLWVTAGLLYLSDRVKVRENAGGRIKAYQAVIVGITQGIAIIPGISRSGSTIAAGIFSGLNRGTAARFSFLISIPAILGASLLEAKDISGINAADLLPYCVGVAMAFISGYLSIDFLLRILVRRRLWSFSIYLFIIGLMGIILT